MAVQKRKAIATVASGVPTLEKEMGTTDEPANEEGEEENQDDESQEQEAEISEEDRLAREEEALTIERRKELKALYMDDLKQVALKKGVEAGKKESLIEAVVAAEAQERAAARAQQAKLRGVVVSKKEELDAIPAAELKALCNSSGIKGVLSKQDRIEQLMKLWLKADGVKRSLAQMAADEREQELVAKDKVALRQLCEAASLDPFVKQVMVERLVRYEATSGKFARPTIGEVPKDEDEGQHKKGKTVNLVDALLENETRRNKEEELKKQREAAEASKRKEYKAMSIDELKKVLSSKGHEAGGKKDDMVEALVQISFQEEAVEARKTSFRVMALDDLKALLTSKGLETGKKETMIDALMAHEAELVETVKAYGMKIEEAVAKIKEDLDAKTASELKEMCASRGLKLGVGKEDRIERLVEDARTNGEAEKAVAAVTRTARETELLVMDQLEVLRLCEASEVDPLVKEVMIERLMSHEAEFGRTAVDEPVAKKPRRA